MSKPNDEVNNPDVPTNPDDLNRPDDLNIPDDSNNSAEAKKPDDSVSNPADDTVECFTIRELEREEDELAAAFVFTYGPGELDDDDWYEV